MTTLRARCVLATAGPLALSALALALVTGWPVGGPPVARVLAASLGVGVLATLVATAVTAGLSRDLAAVRELSTAYKRSQPGAAAGTVEGAALLDALHRLLARADALTAQQARAREDIEAAERLRTSFVATMGHDLKNPLNAIVGFADLLALDAGTASSQRGSIGLIRRSAHDLLVQLDHILLWAKLEAGRLALEPEPVAVEMLLRRVASTAHERSAERGLTVRVHCPPGLPLAQVDTRRVVEAILSLMDHAVRAADGPQVELSARADGERAVVTIHDRSLEIRRADIRRFFEPFRPSHAPSGRRIAGMGLGPALGRALIRAHGGDVSFESRPELGTRFTVLLPGADASALESRAPARLLGG